MMRTSFMAEPFDLLHYAQHLWNVFDRRRTYGNEEHVFVLSGFRHGLIPNGDSMGTSPEGDSNRDQRNPRFSLHPPLPPH